MPKGRADGQDGTETPKDITPTISITNKDAKEAGHYRMEYTDKQLITKIKVLQVVIEYLVARKDAGILVGPLRMELVTCESFLRSRDIWNI
jgi:hypothetical protein